MLDRDCLWDMFSRFIDVLQINVFALDREGCIFLPPEEGGFGVRLLSMRELGVDFFEDSKLSLQAFIRYGDYYKISLEFNVSLFAIPVPVDIDEIVGYVIIGPVILDNQLQSEMCMNGALRLDLDVADVLSCLQEVRVLSGVVMNALLDMLAEIIRNSWHALSIERIDGGKSSVTDFDHALQEIGMILRSDELLVTLLNVSMRMTSTEYGSIMVIDYPSKRLGVKFARGFTGNDIGNVNVKLTESLAGLSVLNDEAFVIQGREADNRIRSFLKRPDIKQAVVMPLKTANNKIFGVLNLHTKSSAANLYNSFKDLQDVARLLSCAVQ